MQVHVGDRVVAEGAEVDATVDSELAGEAAQGVVLEAVQVRD